MYYVYIQFSHADKELYTGYSDDLRARFEKHQRGFVKATRHRRPLQLIYYESYAKELDARRIAVAMFFQLAVRFAHAF